MACHVEHGCIVRLDNTTWSDYLLLNHPSIIARSHCFSLYFFMLTVCLHSLMSPLLVVGIFQLHFNDMPPHPRTHYWVPDEIVVSFNLFLGVVTFMLWTETSAKAGISSLKVNPLLCFPLRARCQACITLLHLSKSDSARRRRQSLDFRPLLLSLSLSPLSPTFARRMMIDVLP